MRMGQGRPAGARGVGYAMLALHPWPLHMDAGNCPEDGRVIIGTVYAYAAERQEASGGENGCLPGEGGFAFLIDCNYGGWGRGAG